MRAMNEKGTSLLEILIAIFIMTFLLFAGSGIYLTGESIARGTINSMNANRNAMLALLHIEKNARNAASAFAILNSIDEDGDSINDLSLQYKVYEGAADIYSSPSITSEYAYLSASKQIRYIPDTSKPDIYTIVGSHIQGCDFDITPSDGVVLNIAVTALDSYDNADSAFTLNTLVEATATASPHVF